MWPSEAWATLIYDVANIALIAGLVIGAIATVLIVWMGNVKETYLKKDLAETTERAAKANERAANLENEAAQAKLELERLKKHLAPRKLDRKAFLKELEGKSKAPVQILFLKDDPDSLNFAQDIEQALGAAGWSVVSRDVIPTPDGVKTRLDIPTTMSVGGQPTGVTVVTNEEDWEGEIKAPRDALYRAFSQAMGRGAGSVHMTCPRGILRIIIGPRW